MLMRFEPAAGAELGDNAGGQESEADAEGAQNPVHLHPTLQHKPVEQGQHEDENRRFREEGRTAGCRYRDEVDEGSGNRLGLGCSSAAG